MATKSIRWTAGILALATLAAVISMWLSDTAPASAHHAQFRIDCPTTTVKEGDSFDVYLVRTKRHGQAGNPFGVGWYTDEASATNADFHPLNGVHQRSIPAEGEADRMKRTIHTKEDTEPEDPERFWVRYYPNDKTPAGQDRCEITIHDDDARPSVPGDLQAVPLGPDSVQLTWKASNGGMVNGESKTPRYVYQIDGNWGPNWGAIPGGNVTSHIVTGLDTANNSYTFRIRAESDAGNSWFTGNVTSDRFRPGVPGNLQAVPIGPYSFRLTWEASDAGTVNGERQTPDYYEYEVRGQREPRKPIPGDATSFDVTGLPTFERTYQFRIKAVINGASSEFTPYWNAGNWRPGTPTNLTATAISREAVVLEWEAGDAGVGRDGNPITPSYTYEIDGHWRDIPDAGVTSHTVTGLDTVNNTYQFRVRAISADVPSWFTGYVTSDLLPPPVIASVEITSDPGDDGFYFAGEIVEVAVTFSKDIIVSVSPDAEGGLPELELDLGGEPRTAEISGGSGARLVFAYVVQAGDEALNGVAVGANKLRVGDGISIQSEDGVEVDLSHDAVPADATHKVDALAPTIVSIAITSNPSSGAADTYTTGEFIHFTVVFSEAMVFEAAGLLEVEVGGSTRILLEDLRHSTGSDTVVFTYQVQVGDEDQDGVSVGANSLTLFGENASVRDVAGHDADLSHDAIPADPNHRVNAPGGL